MRVIGVIRIISYFALSESFPTVQADDDCLSFGFAAHIHRPKSIRAYEYSPGQCIRPFGSMYGTTHSVYSYSIITSCHKLYLTFVLHFISFGCTFHQFINFFIHQSLIGIIRSSFVFLNDIISKPSSLCNPCLSTPGREKEPDGSGSCSCSNRRRRQIICHLTR